MKLSQLTRVAKDAIDKRGGVDAIKQDLQDARHAASSHDNLMDKARAAAGALKHPGRDRTATEATSSETASPSRAAADPLTGQEQPDVNAAAGQDPSPAR